MRHWLEAKAKAAAGPQDETKCNVVSEWEYDYTDAQGVDHLRCKEWRRSLVMIVQEVALPVLRVGLANLIISGLNVINGRSV